MSARVDLSDPLATALTPLVVVERRPWWKRLLIWYASGWGWGSWPQPKAYPINGVRLIRAEIISPTLAAVEFETPAGGRGHVVVPR